MPRIERPTVLSPAERYDRLSQHVKREVAEGRMTEEGGMKVMRELLENLKEQVERKDGV
jgi:polyhydroxyalkanoate synthesis regulator phasin